MQEPSDLESASAFESRVQNKDGYGVCSIHRQRKMSMNGTIMCPSCAIPPGTSTKVNTVDASMTGFKKIINAEGVEELIPVKDSVIRQVSKDERIVMHPAIPESNSSNQDSTLLIRIPKEFLFDIHGLVEKKLRKINPTKDPENYKSYLNVLIELNKHLK